MYEEFLKEKAKYMPTAFLLDRLREVKKIRDKADEEFLALSMELWNRVPTADEVKQKKRGAK